MKTPTGGSVIGIGEGIVSLESAFRFAETVQRLLTILMDHEIKVFATIDQQAEARAVGLWMPPTTLIIFGNPLAGTPLMLAAPTSALDLPLKVLVSEAADGSVVVRFNSAAYLVGRHSLPPELAANLVPPEKLIEQALNYSASGGT